MSAEAEAIQELMHLYAWRFDGGDLEGFAALFERGTLRFEGMGELTGSREVLDFIDRMVMLYNGKPRTNHLMNNVIIHVDEGGETATATSYVTVLQALPDFPLQPIATGRYADRFARTDGRWHFADRLATRSLPGDLSRHLRLERLS